MFIGESNLDSDDLQAISDLKSATGTQYKVRFIDAKSSNPDLDDIQSNQKVHYSRFLNVNKFRQLYH